VQLPQSAHSSHSSLNRRRRLAQCSHATLAVPPAAAAVPSMEAKRCRSSERPGVPPSRLPRTSTWRSSYTLIALLVAGSQPTASCHLPLRACYDTMGGQSWKNAAGRSWLDANIPCCEKEFVTCKLNREIKKINWKAIKGLKGTLPPQLGLLTLLEEIDVEKTAVSGTLSHSLFSLASGIEKLKIRESGITGTVPPTLFLSGSLEEVSARGTGLSGTIPPSRTAERLEELDLGGTAISGTLPNAFFSASSSIVELKIKRSYISGTLPPSLFLSGTLKEMDAKEAGLSGTIPPSIGRAKKLEELDLRESLNCGRGSKKWKRKNCKGFSGTIPPEIGRATQLEEIRFSENSISGSLPASLALLRELEARVISPHISPYLALLRELEARASSRPRRGRQPDSIIGPLSTTKRLATGDVASICTGTGGTGSPREETPMRVLPRSSVSLPHVGLTSASRRPHSASPLHPHAAHRSSSSPRTSSPAPSRGACTSARSASWSMRTRPTLHSRRPTLHGRRRTLPARRLSRPTSGGC